MNKPTFAEFPVDNASILFLSRTYPYHTNSFRFTMTLTEPVCPETLQRAVDHIWKRFPSVIAGFRPGFFRYHQVPAPMPPQVRKDPGCLYTMTKKELQECCWRVYYHGNDVSIEAFHALTDGYGAITTFTTLIAEYLKLKNGAYIPFSETRLNPDDEPQPQEVVDSFLENSDAPAKHLPSRYAYQLPRAGESDWNVRTNSLVLDVKPVLDAAHRHGATLNTLITSVLARSVMEIQKTRETRLKPVRIMVPIDLRRTFHSKTLRNFSLYALPTMEVSDDNKTLTELCDSIGRQLRSHISGEFMGSMISYNVRTQNMLLFRMIPWKIKSAAMRLGYRFFGESNSSLTLTNLGNVRLPEALQPYVTHFQTFLTPRTGSPYGCAVLSYNNKLTINMSRFCSDAELDTVFFRNLQAVVNE